MSALLETATPFAVALGVGLLVGVERERHKGVGESRGPAGVRTFVLLALAGALGQWLGVAALAVAGVGVVALVHAGYRRLPTADPGLTTEVAMLVTFLLGALAIAHPALAGGLGVVVAIVLYSKDRLHPFVREGLSAQELHDLLLIAAAAFVVLPLLPDVSLDPWGAVGLRRLWLLAVALMAVSSAAYVALRVFGPRLGLLLAGFAGGFVSSTATIAAMGDRARASGARRREFASAALASNVSTVLQLAAVLGAFSPPLLRLAALPLVAAGAVAAAAALLSLLGVSRHADSAADALARPFEPRRVLGFVLMLAAVLLVAAAARHLLGEASLPWVLALSGLGDVHAAGASAAQLHAAGEAADGTALFGVAMALAGNSALKCVLAGVRGGRGFLALVAPGIVLMVLAFAAMAFWRP
jgi:uncharacterized membrane protein (DUF4010 family)